jgi:hypothetical protein
MLAQQREPESGANTKPVIPLMGLDEDIRVQ